MILCWNDAAENNHHNRHVIQQLPRLLISTDKCHTTTAT